MTHNETHTGKKRQRKFLKSSLRMPSSLSGVSADDPSRGVAGGCGISNMSANTGELENISWLTRKSVLSTYSDEDSQIAVT
jgi:hypothetical protein